MAVAFYYPIVHHGTIVILRERQLLMRVLKPYILINDTDIYELKEGVPLIIDCHELPVKIVAKNGFHFSRPFYIRKPFASPLYIDVGCEADNGRLWGAVLLSVLMFVLFMTTGIHVFLVLANAPLLFILYKFYIKAKEFFTIEVLKK